MFNIPEKYKVDKEFAIKTFIPKEIKPANKKKLKQSLKKIVLEYQITGEDIPSIINDEYNCQVIAFFSIELEDIKKASFVANMLQEMMKPLTVIRLFDKTHEVYSFAIKRLNKQDKQEIVLEETLLTPKISKMIFDKTKVILNEQLDYETVINKADKLSYYKELFIKCYISININTVSFAKEIFDSKIWYNSDRAMEVYKSFKRINYLKSELNRSTSNTEKTKLISEQKQIIDNIKSIITEG